MDPANRHPWPPAPTQGCSCGCQTEQCSCGCGASCNCRAGDLLDLTYEAKHKLLKEKIKERLQTSMGADLDAMADLAIELFTNKREVKKQKQQNREAMEEKIRRVMP